MAGRDIESIVILTGAGVSAESGLATFRGPGGLWEGRRVEEICTPEALETNRDLVLEFYDQRRRALAGVEPNAAHKALAWLDSVWPGDLLIVTQNVDDLHERAGAKRLVHMHGALNSALCEGCGGRSPFTGDMLDDPACPSCGRRSLRPDIVFFGEMPYEMERIEAALRDADLFVSVGTSGAVYPAAGFVRIARDSGADTLELNLDPSEGSLFFHETRLGPASLLVTEWVEQIMAGEMS